MKRTTKCPKCDQNYHMGYTGTVNGCDVCLGNTRDADGYVYGRDEEYIILQDVVSGEQEVRQRPSALPQ